MDSLSLNKAQQLNKSANNKISFTGQKSEIDIQGTKKYTFYAPPFNKEGRFVALEIVPVENAPDGKGNNTNLMPVGRPKIIPDSLYKLSSDLVFQINADDPNIPSTDMIGYRFAVIDAEEYKRTGDLEAAKIGYLLDSGAAAGQKDQDGKVVDGFSYFAKNQGFVNKTGPMYHIFPDSYNVKDKEDFVRNGFNKAGGTIQGMIEKLKDPNGELSPYEMIISTPLFGGDNISSHGYWTANPYQISASRGNFEDFKKLQIAMFDAGKSYIADGAFTSQSFQGPQFQHVLKWGKRSPFYHWFKLDRPDAPNTNIKLGIFPDSIIEKTKAAGATTRSPEDTRREILKDAISFKIVNPKYVTSDKNNPKSIVPNPDYDSSKPTYMQFYDKRLAGSQGEDIKNLILAYENGTPENHYEVTEHQDSVQPFYFEVDPEDTRFKTKGASLSELDTIGYLAKDGSIRKGYDAFFQMANYSVTTKGQSGGATTWDGNVDLMKMNISNPTLKVDDKLGNKQVKNNFYNIATFWTKTTDNAIMEHLAKSFAEDKDGTLESLEGKYGIQEFEAMDLAEVIEQTSNKTFRKELEQRNLNDVVKSAILDFPLEVIEFAPDLTAVLSTDYVTPRPKNLEESDRLTKADYLKNVSPKVRDLYNDDMYSYVVAVMNKLDEKMPADKKLFDHSAGVQTLSEYGKVVMDLASTDILRYGVVKSLFPEVSVAYDDETHAPVFGPELNSKSLTTLGILESSPENEAKAVVNKMSSGFKKLAKAPNEELVDSLAERFQNIDIKDYELARAFMDKTGAGLNWRFDAAKDVADLDQRRAWNPHATFEKCWDDTIDFWGGFIEKIRDVNPASYIIAEVTELWEFSRYSGSVSISAKNVVAQRKIAEYEKMDPDTKKYVAFKHFKDFKDYVGTGDIPQDTVKAYEKLTPSAVQQNPSLISSEEFKALDKYYRDAWKAEEAMYGHDFGKYSTPDTAERMLYDLTGATSGSNYSTFFGTYPAIFGQDIEKGGVDPGSLYNMGSFQDKLKNFFASNSAQFANGSHIFTNNHDKPRPLHAFALDTNLFLENLKTDDHKQRARAVTGSDDFDNVSSMGVAVGEMYDRNFEAALKSLGATNGEISTVKQAIADLTMGKFLNYTEPNMQRSKAFGFTPFDITMKDVILQARYLNETKGLEWSFASGKKTGDKSLSDKEMQLYNKTFEQLTPALDKLAAMWEMMCCTVGIPTLFAGDELGQSGYETPTKNAELAIRNLVHHEWLKDDGKPFIKEYNDRMMAVTKLHKQPELSALANGWPLIVPQADGDHTALYKYNDQGSGVLVVYSNNQMANDAKLKDIKAKIDAKQREVWDSNDPNEKKRLEGELGAFKRQFREYIATLPMDKTKTETLNHIQLGYIDPNRAQDGPKAFVAQDGTEFKRMKYNAKDGKYEEDPKTYVVKNGKLYSKTTVGVGGSNVSGTSGPVVLDGTVNIFYKVKSGV